jgi:predicted nucleic acid-binding protein
MLWSPSWGKLVARCDAAGRPIGAMDAFIAATAEVHRLTLVTRNVSDFETALPTVVNPWDEQ